MKRGLLWAVGAGLVVAGIVVTNVFFIVNQTEEALVLQFGQPRRVVRQPGLDIKWPFIENVIYYDKRLLDVEPAPEEVIASDQKRLVVDTYTRYRITNPLLFYQSVATEAGVRARLTAMVSASLRQVIGTVPLSALLSRQRAAIMHQIRDQVRAAAKGFGIDVVDTRIRRADLPPQNSEAIYKRMNSEREQIAALYRGEGAQAAAVVKAKAERDRTVILAEAQKEAQQIRGAGDAQAIAIYAKAYGQDESFFSFYRSLDAYRAALTGKNTTFVLTPQGGFFRFFENPSGAPEKRAGAALAPAKAAANPAAKPPAQASAGSAAAPRAAAAPR
jgi:membrane protease subunit HflC